MREFLRATVADESAAIERYRSIRDWTVRLAAPLSPEDCQVQPMPDASPTKWHLAHTTWFFETFLLSPHLPGYRPYHPAFSFLFNSYYNAVGPRVARADRGLITRPGLDEVLAYRAAVDLEVIRRLEALGEDRSSEIDTVLELGLNHEQQHQELIVTDIKATLARNPIRPAYRDDLEVLESPAPPMTWHAFPAGLDQIGQNGIGFAFDNESPRHAVHVEAFELASRPVTVGEYRGFMEDGGYQRAEHWLSDGWACIHSNGWDAPLYWEKINGQWRAFTMGGMRPLVDSEPVVHLSYYEADAFARWAGARLPTEAEWEIAAREEPIVGNFLENEAFHPRPAVPGTGLAQCFGDVWEWTQSPYTAYPGMRAAAGALGEYNAKFMCNQIVLRGGSCATPASHIRPSYRNFFPPEARWQFSGIRLARS